MNENPETRPSFFKVVALDDFTHRLRLPPMFMRKYGPILHERVILRIESGRLWDVRVEAIEEKVVEEAIEEEEVVEEAIEKDKMFCFSSLGWNSFTRHVGLDLGDFLVFMLNDGGYLFDVSIYDTSGCKKEFPTVARNPSFRNESRVPTVAQNPNLKRGESSAVPTIAENPNSKRGESSAVPTVAQNPNLKRGESSAVPTVARNPNFGKGESSAEPKVARNPNLGKGESSAVPTVARNPNLGKGESSAVSTIARNPNLKGESSTVPTVARNPNFIKEESPEVPTIARNPNLERMSNPFYYEIVLKSHHQSRVTPKRPFARAAGLMEKQRVKLVGERGSQFVELERDFKDAMRVDLTHGWTEFRTDNGLVYGKTYSFEFKPDQNVIIVKEVQD